MINALGHGGSETPHLHPFAILWFVESQHKYFSKPLCYDSESYAAILANLAEVGHLIDRETWVRVYGQVGTHDDLTNCGKAMKDCFRQVIKNMTAEMDAKAREVPHDPSRLAEIADAPALARASVADILSHFAHTIQSPDWLLKFKGTELSYCMLPEELCRSWLMHRQSQIVEPLTFKDSEAKERVPASYYR